MYLIVKVLYWLTYETVPMWLFGIFWVTTFIESAYILHKYSKDGKR